jgi:hypothetical protein
MERQVISGLMLSLVLAGSSSAVPRAKQTERSKNEEQITIRIHNYAKVKASILLPAERAAADIFREAGVDSLWVNCFAGGAELAEAACANPVTPLDLVLNLLPRSMAQRLHFHDEVFGFAMEATGKEFGLFASVFYDNVKDCAVQRHLDLAQLLGDAIAHELAHLLLGANSHSSHGLMCASWSGKKLLVAEQRGLSFLSSETQRLQITLTARRLAALSPELPAMTDTQTGSAAAINRKLPTPWPNAVTVHLKSGRSALVQIGFSRRPNSDGIENSSD